MTREQTPPQVKTIYQIEDLCKRLKWGVMWDTITNRGWQVYIPEKEWGKGYTPLGFDANIIKAFNIAIFNVWNNLTPDQQAQITAICKEEQ